MAGVDDYSITAASNTTLNAIPVSNSTLPNQVDDLVRQLMADIRRALNDVGAKAVSGGAADVQTLTTETVLTAYADGTLLAFIAGFTNTGAATLNVDAVGAKAIRKKGDVALEANDIVAGMPVLVAYDASANSAAGAWMLFNPASGGADPVSDDGDSLGTTALKWSDLFLASGAVINFNSGDVTLTHAANTLTFTGGALVVDSGGSADFNAATEFKIPVSAAPTVNANGEIALDTTVTDWSHGIIRYFGGEELALLAIPVAELAGMTDGQVVAYNATNDELELVTPSSGLAAATQAEMETGTSVLVASTPGGQHFHPGHPKCWAHVNGGASPSLATSYNITSITDTALGRLTVTIATDFSSADWACLATGEWAQTIATDGTGAVRFVEIDSGTLAAGSVVLEGAEITHNGSDTLNADPTSWHMVGFGDHA